jgi:hypothetical protein
MRLAKLSALLCSLTLGALAACGGSSPKTSTTQSAPAAAADPTCPVEVPGTSVTVEDTATGAALVFVTTGDAAELRRRVAAIAQMHNEHHAKMGALPDGSGGGGHEGHEGHDMAGHQGHDMSGHDMSGHDMTGHQGHGAGQGAGTMIMVHSKATATDVPSGARVELTVGAADVGKLQSELRMHAQHLASGTCKMAGSHGEMHGGAADNQPGGATPAPPAQTDPHAGHH